MKKATTLLIFGIVLALGPLWGILGTMIGMVGALNALSEQTGQAKEAALASGVSFSFYTSLAGFVACPIGIGILVISIFWMRRIKKNVNLEIEQEAL